MAKIIRQMNKMAKDPELEKLNIKIEDKEWEEALSQIMNRRDMIKGTGKGITKATQNIVYQRVVKRKVIKGLLDQLKSGKLKSGNPESYADRYTRIQKNLGDLFEKEGINYKKVSRRELAKRVGDIFEPEIKKAKQKALDYSERYPTILKELFYGNPNIDEGLKLAGINNSKMKFMIKMLSYLSGLE